MKTFESIDHFVNHYKKKKTIAKNIEINLNGNVHSFERRSTHNRDVIAKGQWDQYTFREDDFIANLGLELKINYYRYFDEKALFEVYFELLTPYGYYDKCQRLICPIYFYDKFITAEDYHLDGKFHYSKSIKDWTGLKFVNTRIDAYDFLDFRSNAFTEIKKELFYQSMYDRDTLEEVEFKNKWQINDKGQSPYFIEIIDITKSWEERDEI
jgi:hypothetical protein